VGRRHHRLLSGGVLRSRHSAPGYQCKADAPGSPDFHELGGFPLRLALPPLPVSVLQLSLFVHSGRFLTIPGCSLSRRMGNRRTTTNVANARALEIGVAK
jgi:hypothetical protein